MARILKQFAFVALFSLGAARLACAVNSIIVTPVPALPPTTDAATWSVSFSVNADETNPSNNEGGVQMVQCSMDGGVTWEKIVSFPKGKRTSTYQGTYSWPLVKGPNAIQFRANCQYGSNPVSNTLNVTFDDAPVVLYPVSTRIYPEGAGVIILEPAGGEYPAGTRVTLTAVPDAFHEFMDWSGGSCDGTANPATVTVPCNGITASFSPKIIPLTVYPKPMDGGTVTMNPPGGNYPYGAQVTLTAVPNTGWKFVQWVGNTANPNSAVTTVTADGSVIYADFSPLKMLPLTVQANPAEAGTIAMDPPGGTYLEGTQVTLTAGPNQYWDFSNWTGNAANPNSAVTTVIVDGTAETANFTPKTMSLNPQVIPPETGTVTMDPPGGTYPYGTRVTLTATANSDWTFVYWNGQVSDRNNAVTTYTVDGNSPYAVFKQIPMILLKAYANPQEAGTVTVNPPGGTYPFGTQVTLTVTANSGWNFSHWEGPVADPNNMVTTFNVTESAAIAVFTPAPLPLNVLINPASGGSVSMNPPGGSYPPGTHVTLTAVPNSGWYFSHWEGTVVNPYAAVTSVSVDGHAVTAVFTQTLLQFSIAATPLNGGTVTMNPAGIQPGNRYPIGSQVIVTAVPLDGYRFAGWSGSLGIYGATNPLTMIVNQSPLAAAMFEPVLNGAAQ